MTNERTVTIDLDQIEKVDLVDAIVTLAKIIRLQAFGQDLEKLTAQQVVFTAANAVAQNDAQRPLAKLLAELIASPVERQTSIAGASESDRNSLNSGRIRSVTNDTHSRNFRSDKISSSSQLFQFCQRDNLHR